MTKPDFEQMLNSYVAITGDGFGFDASVVDIDPAGSTPILEEATITLPGKKPTKIKVVSVKKDYKPKYILKKPDFYLKMYAHDQVVRWSVRLIRDIKQIKFYIKILKDKNSSKEDKQKAETIDRQIELLFSDAHHWYDAVTSSGFSKKVRKEVQRNLDKKLRGEIQHLRNIKEHWAQNQLYFYGKQLKESRDTKSVKWYIDNYPESDPWSLTFPGGGGEPRIAGIFEVSRIEKELLKIIKIIEKNVIEHVLFGDIKAKY